EPEHLPLDRSGHVREKLMIEDCKIALRQPPEPAEPLERAFLERRDRAVDAALAQVRKKEREPRPVAGRDLAEFVQKKNAHPPANYSCWAMPMRISAHRQKVDDYCWLNLSVRSSTLLSCV